VVALSLAAGTRPLAGTPVAVVGANGYVGRLLVPLLVAAGADVRAIAREPGSLSGLAGIARARGDAGDSTTLAESVHGAALVYDLTRPDRVGDDADAIARSVEEAASRAGARRVVRLRPLAAAPTPIAERSLEVVELRMAPVLGAASPLLVVARRLAERLPVMAYPRWAAREIQPTSAGDAVRYLRLSGHSAELEGAYEVGGPEPVTVRELLETVARCLGRRPMATALPLELAGLSALTIRTVTGIDPHDVLPLDGGAQGVVHDRRLIEQADFSPVPLELAVRAALAASGRRRT
jgi:uncharacterized protein YbjT (DUF2867 family)